MQATSLEVPSPRLKSPFHLTGEQITFFDENGYLVLRGRLQGELLRRLQEAGTLWLEQTETARQALLKDPDAQTPDYIFAKRGNGQKVPFRVNYLHNKNHPASLEALGSPEILGIAESLAGRNFVPTYESMVFKMPGDGEIVPWHQDAVFEARRHRVFNIDIYLDAAGPQTGALRVLPRSQTAIRDVCPLNDGTYDWDNGPHIIVNMEPGDVLIHDDMVVHGSPRTLNNPLRRVVYFEFRPIEQILEDRTWDRSFADQRLRIVPVALKHFRERYPDRTGFDWDIDPEYRPQSSEDEEVEMRIFHTVHTRGSYCSANS